MFLLQLGVLKDKIKTSNSKEEIESLRLSEKSLINKVHLSAVFWEHSWHVKILLFLFYNLVNGIHLLCIATILQIYTDSAAAKIPAVLEYLGTIIEVSSSCTTRMKEDKWSCVHDFIHEFYLNSRPFLRPICSATDLKQCDLLGYHLHKWSGTV